jgi:thiol-disulfide isomerase/thioredoxin
MLALIGAGVYGYHWYRDAQLPPAFQESPGFSLFNYEGNEMSLSDFTNKLVVAHSWASWCVYCADELKNLAALKAEYGDRIAVVAINRAEPRQVAKDFTDALDLPEGVVILLDPTDAFYKKNGGYAMPETIGLMPDGTVLFHQRGPLKAEELRKHIDSAVAR